MSIAGCLILIAVMPAPPAALPRDFDLAPRSAILAPTPHPPLSEPVPAPAEKPDRDEAHNLSWQLPAGLFALDPALPRGRTGFGARLGNDYFALVGEGNDMGFTNDVDVYLFATRESFADSGRHSTAFRLGVRHTIFREDSDQNRRRFDIGRVYFDGELPLVRRGRLTLALSQYADAFYRGDLGGKQVQDVVHRLPGIYGDTVGDGLDDRYPRARFGATVGLSALLEIDLSPPRAVYIGYVSEAGGKLAPFATGYSTAQIQSGLRAELRALAHLHLFGQAFIGLGEATSRDPLLRLRGAFTNELGTLWGPSMELGLRLRSFASRWLTFSVRAARNEEGVGSWRGSGPMGWVGLELGGGSWLERQGD